MRASAGLALAFGGSVLILYLLSGHLPFDASSSKGKSGSGGSGGSSGGSGGGKSQ